MIKNRKNQISPVFSSIILSVILFLSNIPKCQTLNNVKISIFEETPIGTVIGTLTEHLSVELMSRQNQLNFVIMKTEMSDYVNISQTYGKIVINKRIDKENLCPKTKECTIKVSVNCNNGFNFMEILEVLIDIVDINDNKCSFVASQYQTIIWSENSPRMDTKEFLNRPEDLDTHYSVRRSEIRLLNKSDFFRLDIHSSSTLTRPFSLELVLIGDLDYETATSHQIIVEAGDGNDEHKCQLTVEIEVRDINDNNPVFPSDTYRTEISENYTLFKSFFRVSATDKDSGVNAKIFYQIDDFVENDIKSQFGINSTGELYLKKPLKYHENILYKIPIIARNVNMFSRFGTCQIIVTVTDINNEVPEITIFSAITGTPRVTIKEEQLPGKDVGIVNVVDRDSGNNARVDCKIIRESLLDSMELRPTSSNNQYRLVTKVKIDREKYSSISLTIQCHDFGNPRLTSEKLLAIDILDINDNEPKFPENKYDIHINEDSDPERKKQRFWIKKFEAIDADEGQNSEIFYSIRFKDQPPSDLISIDSKTGILSSNGKIDREIMSSLSFVVVATDHGEKKLSSSVSVVCTILDINDNAPEFSVEHGYTFFISENNKPTKFVGRFFAKDVDYGSNAKLAFNVETGDNNFPFKIYSKKLTPQEKIQFNSELYDWSVEIFTTMSIDREAVNSMVKNDPSYEFLIRAQDFGIPRLAKRVKIKISILDENDNSPQFTFPSTNNSRLTVPCLQKKNYRLGKIDATDIDNGINGSVEYKILDEELKKLFDLNILTGDLTLSRSLGKIDVGMYNLKIAAYDRGIPMKMTTQMLEIEIDNSNTIGNICNPESLFNSEQALNLYIIIAIIIASCVISIVMLTAICIVLKKSRLQRIRELRAESIKDNHSDRVNFGGSGGIRNSHSTSLLALSQLQNSPELVSSTFYRTLSNDQITPTSLRQFIQPYPSLMPEEQQCSNNSTDMDSGKGDSVDACAQNRTLCSFDTCFPLNDPSTLSKLSNMIPNSSTVRFTTTMDLDPSIVTYSLNSTFNKPNNNKDMYGYFRPRFIHLSHGAKTSGEYILTNDDQYAASYI